MKASPPRPEPRERTLHVAVHPPSARATVRVRPLGADAGADRPLARRGKTGHAIALAPGAYLVTLEALGARTEHRPVELGARDLHVDLYLVAVGERRVRLGGRRLPCPVPADRFDAFLAPGSGGLVVAEVIARAAALGLRFDVKRVADPGLLRVVRAMARARAVDERAADERAVDERPAAERPAAERPAAERPADDIPAVARPPVRWPLEPDTRALLDAMAPEQVSERTAAVIPFAATHAITPDAIAALRALPGVIAAGHSLRAEADWPAVRRPAIDVRLAPGVHPGRLRAVVGRRWAALMRPVEARRDAVHAIAGHLRFDLPPELDEEIEDLADTLLSTGLVHHAEPRVAQRSVPLGDLPDLGADRQWDLARIDAEGAHAAFSPSHRPGQGVRVGVIDEGIALLGGQVLHADLVDRVTLYRADGARGGHEHVFIGHGGSVAALVAATEHEGPGAGMRGVAPHAELDALAFNAAGVEAVADVFRVAGGLAGRSEPRPADVIVFAMMVDHVTATTAPPPPGFVPFVAGPAPDVFEMLARRGRGGRGCVMVLAAGNEGMPLASRNPLAASPHVLTVGASDVVGEAEVFAKASNHGDGVDCVAPGYRGSSPETFSVHRMARDRWPAESLLRGEVERVTTDAGGEPIGVVVRFASAARADALRIPRNGRVVFGGLGRARILWTVTATTALDPTGGRIGLAIRRAGLYGTAPREPIAVDAVADFADLRRATFVGPARDGRVQLSALLPPGTRWVTLAHPSVASLRAEVVLDSQGRDPRTGALIGRFAPATTAAAFPVGAEVWTSASGHDERFGQSSAAAALGAGVAALVLSANPALTATEARALIVEAAVPIPGQPGRDPERIYPRVDARRAVLAALAYAHPRDLGFVSRDTGEASPESDDVWFRAAPYPGDAVIFTPASGLDDTHEPIADGGRICARLHNLGGAAASLAAAVRFYVAAPTDDGEFIWPRDFAAGAGYRGVALAPGSYLLGQVEIPAGIAPGDARVVQIPWPAWATPGPGSTWARNLLVEVAPHDGPRVGATIADNPNLARRRLVSGEGSP